MWLRGEPDAAAGQAQGTRWDRLESLLDRLSDRVNPILIKEARQAMKSRQFVITFTLLLVCAWGWSFLGVALLSPGIYYAPGGREMLIGYYYVLAFPLLVIVPYGAFRSLASEREDGTYELLSISTLAPRQIVGGKLGSAALQMVVYLSALSPCVAFTYLLRGVDILLLVIVLVLVFLVSLFLSVVGLLLATLTRARHWHVVMSVAMIVGLVMAFIYFSLGVTVGIIGEEAIPVDQPMFWTIMAALMTGYLSIFSLIFLAASAQISFASDNRSTRLRIAMLVQYLLLVGWMSWFWFYDRVEVGLVIFIILSALHWYVMGAFMTGESRDLSPRVKRRLPKTFMGRVFLTWFFPGPATGYFFAVASMFSATVLVVLASTQPVFASLAAPTVSSSDLLDELSLTLVLFCYLLIYLGLGRLVVGIASRWMQTGVVFSFLVNIILVALGALVPLVIQFSLIDVLTGADDYTPLQITNVFWTFWEVVDRHSILEYTIGLGGWECPVVLVVLGLMALVVLGVNFVVSARDMVPVRASVPARVEQDELALHPEKALRVPKRTSPWDEVGN
jgi:hypothetical protein